MLEGQTQVIKAQDDLIKGHSELIKTQTELIKAQNLTIDKLVSLIKIVPTPSFTEADRAILSMHTIALISQGALPTNMATLLQRCISAGFQVRQPASTEGERTVNTSDATIDVEVEEEDEDEDCEETQDDDTLSKSRRDDDDDDDDENDVIQVNRIAVRKTTPADTGGTSATKKTPEEKQPSEKRSPGGAKAEGEQVQQTDPSDTTLPNPTLSQIPHSPTTSDQQPISNVLKT